MKIALVTVSIWRDAMTNLSVTIPTHEVEVAKSIFGEDNVHVTAEQAGVVELDPAAEGERLKDKYGEAAIVKMFGENYKGAVARSLSSHEVTSKAKPAKEAAPA